MKFEFDTDKMIDGVVSAALEKEIGGKTLGQWMEEIKKFQWISVKDRLPEVDKSVLYCAFGRSVGEGVYRGFDGRHHVWNMYSVSGTHWDNEVTHWMPLPEPPKEDD